MPNQEVYTDYEKEITISPLEEVKQLVFENPNDADLGRKIRELINKYYTHEPSY